MLYDNIIYSPDEMKSAICDFLSILSDDVFLDEALEFKIKIIVSELVTNCFLHDEESSYVRVLGKPKDGCISIVLLENGPGFDISAVLASMNIAGENMDLRESGRGLQIVSILSDVLRYNRKGNIIAIKVNLV